jgi:peptidoglycan/LPS O-acetylase OafA/YrhL
MHARQKKDALENKLFGLDHLRALAIILVFFFHYQVAFSHPAWVETIGSFGWSGVDLFFVLSGYLIAGQLFSRVDRGKKISLKEFYIKRFFRIIPIYLLIVAVYFSLPSFREKEALPPLWRFLTFTQNFGLNPKDYGTFSHAWSLCVEEQFYLLLPLTMLVFLHFNAGRKAFYLVLFLFILGFITRTISWNNFVEPGIKNANFRLPYFKWVYYPTYNRLDGLLAGISIAGVFQFYPKIRERVAGYGNLILLLGLLIIIVAYILCTDLFTFNAAVFGFPLVSIGFGCLVASAVLPSSLLYKYKSKLTIHIAALSYAIYLSHKIVIHLAQVNFGKLGIKDTSILMLFICIISCWLVALALRYAIEKPFLQLRQIILENNRLRTTSPLPLMPQADAVIAREEKT